MLPCGGSLSLSQSLIPSGIRFLTQGEPGRSRAVIKTGTGLQISTYDAKFIMKLDVRTDGKPNTDHDHESRVTRRTYHTQLIWEIHTSSSTTAHLLQF